MSKRNPLKILHLDLETAPADTAVFSLRQRYINPKYIRKPGYTLCWAAKFEGQRQIHFSSIHRDGLKTMLTKMHALLNEADAIVHYNGTKFDMPTLNREFVKFGLPPISHVHEIDLLKTVRKRFKFESNKLDYVCQMLGIGAKTKHKGIDLWYGCMEGNERDWKMMERYNKQDVRLLPRLYKRLLPWVVGHPNVGLWKERKKRTCAHCGSTNLHTLKQTYKSKTMEYEQYQCLTCHTPLRATESVGGASKNMTVRIP